MSTILLVHVVLSLIGIVSGLVVFLGLLRGQKLVGWTMLFLATTILTSATGYALPFDRVLPSHIVGGISLLVLAIALAALYLFRLAGPWRWIFVATAAIALYLNVFVGVVQAFQKVPFLNPLAPTQSEPAFFVTQIVVLLLFILLGITAARRFRPSLPS
jgi:uncharacterized membrane protein